MSKEMNLPPIINLMVDWDKRKDARAAAVQALAELMPVFGVCAQFVPEEGYAYKGNGGKEDRLNARCWAPMRGTAEYAAVMQTLTDYLRYTFAKSYKVTAFIEANDNSVSANDLYSLCVMYVLGKLPVFLSNVSTRYESRKGMVGKAEGAMLYIDHSVGTFLIDQARKLDSNFGRNKKQADLFDTAGRVIRSAEELNPDDAVVRKGSRVGLYQGDKYINGIRYGFFRFVDSCDEYIPWGIIADRIRVFSGDLMEAAAEISNEEEKKFSTNAPISLDEELGGDEDDGVSLMNLIPGCKSCEEMLIASEEHSIVRETYRSTMHALRGNLLQQLMLSVLVNDELCMRLTHADTLLSAIRETGVHQLVRDNHELNCAILSLEEEELQTLTASQVSYTVKELTMAKHQVKKLFRRNLSLAMAA